MIFWGLRQDATGLYTWQEASRPAPDFLARERVVGASFTVLNGPAKGETGLITALERRVFTDGNQEREMDYLVFDRELPANPGSHCAVMVEKAGPRGGPFLHKFSLAGA